MAKIKVHAYRTTDGQFRFEMKNLSGDDAMNVELALRESGQFDIERHAEKIEPPPVADDDMRAFYNNQ